jgi:hypothetical protein
VATVAIENREFRRSIGLACSKRLDRIGWQRGESLLLSIKDTPADVEPSRPGMGS